MRWRKGKRDDMGQREKSSELFFNGRDVFIPTAKVSVFATRHFPCRVNAVKFAAMFPCLQVK